MRRSLVYEPHRKPIKIKKSFYLQGNNTKSYRLRRSNDRNIHGRELYSIFQLK